MHHSDVFKSSHTNCQRFLLTTDAHAELVRISHFITNGGRRRRDQPRGRATRSRSTVAQRGRLRQASRRQGTQGEATCEHRTGSAAVLKLLTVTQAYDSHCNLVLGEVEETIYEIDEDDEDEEVKVRCPNFLDIC